MKYLIIGLLILFSISAACIASNCLIQAKTEDVKIPLLAAFDAALKGDRSTARICIGIANQRWLDTLPIFDSLLSHEKTDEITLCLDSLRRSDLPEYPGRCTDLLLRLRQLESQELPLAQNVL